MATRAHKSASAAIFDELFAEFAEEGVEQAAAKRVQQLAEAQRRVRRLLDRGAPRETGAALKKAATALEAAKRALPALASAGPKRRGKP